MPKLSVHKRTQIAILVGASTKRQKEQAEVHHARCKLCQETVRELKIIQALQRLGLDAS